MIFQITNDCKIELQGLNESIVQKKNGATLFLDVKKDNCVAWWNEYYLWTNQKQQ